MYFQFSSSVDGLKFSQTLFAISTSNDQLLSHILEKSNSISERTREKKKVYDQKDESLSDLIIAHLKQIYNFPFTNRPPRGRGRNQIEFLLYKIVSHVLSIIGWFQFPSSTVSQARRDFEEHIFVARDRQASHWMIESELFFGFAQQILKRRMLQVRNRNHMSSLLGLSNVDCEKPLWNSR